MIERRPPVGHQRDGREDSLRPSAKRRASRPRISPTDPQVLRRRVRSAPLDPVHAFRHQVELPLVAAICLVLLWRSSSRASAEFDVRTLHQDCGITPPLSLAFIGGVSALDAGTAADADAETPSITRLEGSRWRGGRLWSWNQDNRHTAASLLAELGEPAAIRKEVMGHGNIATTQRYTHLRPVHEIPAHERLADAVPIADLVTASRKRAAGKGDGKND